MLVLIPIFLDMRKSRYDMVAHELYVLLDWSDKETEPVCQFLTRKHGFKLHVIKEIFC